MSDYENDCKRDSIRKRTSLVWQYFEKLSSVRVKCRICNHHQRYMGNTANALRHLKVKHEIDARACGLEDPENVRRMKALSVSAVTLEQTIVTVKNEHGSTLNYSTDNEDDHLHEGRGRRSSSNRNYIQYNEETEVDPYGAENEPLMDFVDTDNFSQVDVKHVDTTSPPPPPSNRNAADNNDASETKRRRSSLEEKRIMAETEYYREKAGYFRIQKHLAALQAKKVKYELDQLFGK